MPYLQFCFPGRRFGMIDAGVVLMGDEVLGADPILLELSIQVVCLHTCHHSLAHCRTHSAVLTWDASHVA